MKLNPVIIKEFLILSLTAFSLISISTKKTNAGPYLTNYCTVISDRDRYNTNGQRLATPGAILQQDRANYHRFNRRDPGDGWEGYFTTYNQRVYLNQMVQRSFLNPRQRQAILYGGNVYVCLQFNSGNVYISFR